MKTALAALAVVLLSLTTRGAALDLSAPSAPPPAPPTAPAVPPAARPAAPAKNETVLLRDGSTLLAAPGASYDIVRDGPTLVMIYLRAGKLWADVVKRKTRPFEVRTPYCVAAV